MRLATWNLRTNVSMSSGGEGGEELKKIHGRWVDVSYRTIMPREYLATFTHDVPLIAD